MTKKDKKSIPALVDQETSNDDVDKILDALLEDEQEKVRDYIERRFEIGQSTHSGPLPDGQTLR